MKDKAFFLSITLLTQTTLFYNLYPFLWSEAETKRYLSYNQSVELFSYFS